MAMKGLTRDLTELVDALFAYEHGLVFSFALLVRTKMKMKVCIMISV